MKKGKGCLIGAGLLVVIIIIVIIAVSSGGDKSPVTTPPDEGVTGVAPDVTPEPEEASETVSQKNAVKSAEQYLAVMAFSKSGLIEQLEFEGYDTDDATYAVNKINVDWMEQAVKKAEEYLDTMAFSRAGLIEQLEFEGFSKEEATYAVGEVGF